jgi:ATP/maltotriose-dependent transcriptional regulator MalT
VKGDKAREAILNKHKDLEERFPVQLARHWFTMASLSAKAGDFAQARRQIGEAKRLAPKNPKYVAFFAFAVLKEVTRWLPSVKR